MKPFKFLATGLLTFSVAQAGSGRPVSPFPSQIPGITVPNARLVSRREGAVIRGAGPVGKVEELKKAGITEVVIFKADNSGEVKKEISEFLSLGMPASKIHHFPFSWQTLDDYHEACLLTFPALQILHSALHTPGEAVFFHCTMGEDRTGMLAGLFRIAEEGWSVRKAFEQEMCANGYEAGDSHKPRKIMMDVRKKMTPIFLKLAYLIQKAQASRFPLTQALCSAPASADAEAALRRIPEPDFASLTCRPASLR